MSDVMVPNAAVRAEHRDAAKGIRANAGIEGATKIAAVAEIGAAARRLRQSNRWADDGPVRTHQQVTPVAPVRVASAPHVASDQQAAKRVHPAGASLPKRLRLV